MKMIEIFTIGVYSRSEIEFFDELQKTRINLFIDVRNRRGMRGALYSFVNSTKLQATLEQMGIGYLHAKYLAPPESVRDLQKKADTEQKQLKRDRSVMSSAFINAFQEQVLSDEVIDLLESDVKSYATLAGISAQLRICFFCVEREPEACHRSLVSQALADRIEAVVRHL